MPKVTVRVPHSLEPAAALARLKPALEKTVTDFQGHDLVQEGSDTSTSFTFRSMAFTIKGRGLAMALVDDARSEAAPVAGPAALLGARAVHVSLDRAPPLVTGAVRSDINE